MEDLFPSELPSYAVSHVYHFGAATLGAFIMLVVTGAWMVANGPLWYQGSGFGHFIHAVHFWSAQVFFFAMALHLATNFFMGAWREGRGLTWVVGAMILGVAVLEGFIGYALRGDFASQWHAVQSKDAYNALGLGAWFNPMNSGQMLGLHIVVMPLVIAALVGAHLWLVRTRGLVPPYPVAEGRKA